MNRAASAPRLWLYLTPALLCAGGYPLLALGLGLRFSEGLRLPFWLSLPLCMAAALTSAWLTARSVRQSAPRDIFRLAGTVQHIQTAFAAARLLRVPELLLVVLACGFAADTPEGTRIAVPVLYAALAAVPAAWLCAGIVARALADRTAALGFLDAESAGRLRQAAMITPHRTSRRLAEMIRRYQPENNVNS